VRVDLIPDPEVQEETRTVCSTSGSCWVEAIDEAPVCQAIKAGTLWPSAELVSTYSHELDVQNGVKIDENGTYYGYWECPAAPGRFVPVCMQGTSELFSSIIYSSTLISLSAIYQLLVS